MRIDKSEVIVLNTEMRTKMNELFVQLYFVVTLDNTKKFPTSGKCTDYDAFR